MSLDRILEILSALVAFDTTSRNSNLPIIDWIERHLDGLGFVSERIYDASGQWANLYATIGPADVPGYILSGHTDVVGCVGARGIVERLAERPTKPLGCFVGEPTQMGIVIGHKGKRSVRVKVRGFTCHSSLAPQGVNAAEFAALLVTHIRGLADRLAVEGARDPMYDVPFSTPHVGVLRSGTALNIVPDEAEIVFEVRSIGADDPDALVEGIIAYARETLEPRMKAVDPATGFAFDVFAGFPGLDTAPDAEIFTLAKSLAGSNGYSKVAFGTEAGLFQHVAGVPSVVVGPGSIDQAHKADEWIALAELERCAAFVERLVESCGV
jgi:acetylornithine deacetylase